MSFLNLENPTILDPVCYFPGLLTKNMEWAAVPYGTRFMIIHNGKQVQVANTIQSASNHIEKYLKIQSKTQSSPLDLL